MIYGHEDSWVAQKLVQEAWYVTNVAIGDVDPAEPGLEIVNVGWHGNVSMVYWEDATSTWKHKELVNGNNAGLTWGYGIAIGDMDPRYPGNEVAATDDSGHLLMIHKNGTGWSYEHIWQDVGPGIIDPYLDTVILGDVDPSHPGDEMLLTGGSKYVTEIFYNTTAGNWTVKRLWKDKSSPIQLAVGDIDPRYTGNEIAVVGLDKNMTVLHWNGTAWAPERVYKDSDVIYDIKIGEIQPDRGAEVVMGGWSGKVTAHKMQTGAAGWESRLLYQDDNFVFGVAIGEFDDLHPGNEIIAVDRAGVVKKLQFETPDFALYCPGSVNSAVPGATATFDILAYSRAGYKEPVSFSVQGLPEGWNASFSPSKVAPTGKSLMTVNLFVDAPEGDVKLTVKGVSGAKEHSIDVWVNVLPPDEKDFGLLALPSDQSVVADYSVKYTIALYQVNGFAAPVSCSVEGLPDGTTGTLSSTTLTPPGSVTLEIRTVSSTPIGTHYLTITCKGGGKEHSTTVILFVKDPSSPDFSIGLGPSTVTMVGSHSANISVNVISVYGFAQGVTLSVPGIMSGVTATFSPKAVVPSGTSFMNLTINASVPADTYYFEIQGTAGSLSHSAVLRVDLNTVGKPDFTLKVYPEQANVTASFSAFYNLSVMPVDDFDAQVGLTIQGLPSDATATFSPQAIGPYHFSKLEVKTLLSTPAGTYHLIVTGKGSGLVRTTYMDLRVDPAKASLDLVKVQGVPATAQDGQVIRIHVWVQNNGIIDAPNCELSLFVDKGIVATKQFGVKVGGLTEVNISWKAVQGKHNVTLTIVAKGPADLERDRYTRTMDVSSPTAVVGGTIGLLIISIIVIVVVTVAIGYLIGRRGGKKKGTAEPVKPMKKATGPKKRPSMKRKAGPT